MSASRNVDSIVEGKAGEEFSSRVPPSEPLTTKGHAPGVKVGNDAKPEFYAETLPPGTAPKYRTFQPEPVNKVPGQAQNPDINPETRTDVNDTIVGAMSADVHTGYGHPSSGQSSQQLNGSELEKGRKEGAGLARVGAGDEKFFGGDGRLDDQGADPLERSAKSRKHGNDAEAGEDKLPVSSEELGAERQ